MRSFALDETGDIVLAGGDIGYVAGDDLLVQTIRQVVGTNRGEWFLNTNEGMDFRAILTKNPDTGVVRDEIQAALLQVDPSLRITSFETELAGRALRVKVTAQNGAGARVDVDQAFG